MPSSHQAWRLMQKISLFRPNEVKGKRGMITFVCNYVATFIFYMQLIQFQMNGIGKYKEYNILGHCQLL